MVNKSFLTTPSVLYDAVYLPDGINSSGTLEANPDASRFINEVDDHCKLIAADLSAMQVLSTTNF